MSDEIKELEIIEEIKRENTITVYRVFRFNSIFDERWRYGYYLEGEDGIKIHWSYSYSPTFYGFKEDYLSFSLSKQIEIKEAILHLPIHRLRNVTNPYKIRFRPLMLIESKTITK